MARYGPRLLEKRAANTLTNELPRVRRTQATFTQKDIVTDADNFMRELVHENYNIWTGERELAKQRKHDYYYRGWNYGGTGEVQNA